MKLQPLEDRIVVRSNEPEETTVSGLVIPDTAKEKPQEGEVLAVGPGRRAEHSGEVIPLAPQARRPRSLHCGAGRNPRSGLVSLDRAAVFPAQLNSSVMGVGGLVSAGFLGVGVLVFTRTEHAILKEI